MELDKLKERELKEVAEILRVSEDQIPKTIQRFQKEISERKTLVQKLREQLRQY